MHACFSHSRRGKLFLFFFAGFQEVEAGLGGIKPGKQTSSLLLCLFLLSLTPVLGSEGPGAAAGLAGAGMLEGLEGLEGAPERP